MPEPIIAPTLACPSETEKVQKPAKISRKKRKFLNMLGGCSTAVGGASSTAALGTGTALANDGMSAFQTPFGYSAGMDNQQMQGQDDCKFLDDSLNQITPSDQVRQR